MASCENLATKSDIQRLENKIQALNKKLQKIINLLNNLSGKVDALKQLIKSLEAIIKAQINAIKQVLLSAINAVRAIVQSILSLLQALFGPKPPEIDYGKIQSIANGAANKAANSAISQIKSAINSAKSEILAAINKLKPPEIDYDRIKSIANSAAGKAADRAINQLKSAINSAKSEILAAINKIKPPEIDYERIKSIANSAASSAADRAISQIKSAINSAKSEILAAINKLDFPSLEEIKKKLNQILNRLSSLSRKIDSIKQLIKSLEGIITTAINSLKAIIVAQIQALSATIQSLIALIRSLLSPQQPPEIDYSKIRSIISSEVAPIKTKIDNLGYELTQRISKSAQRILQVKNGVDKLLDRSSKTGDTADLSAIEAKLNQLLLLGNKINTKADEILNKLKNLSSPDLKEINRKLTQIISILRGLQTSLNTKLGGLGDLFNKIPDLGEILSTVRKIYQKAIIIDDIYRIIKNLPSTINKLQSLLDRLFASVENLLSFLDDLLKLKSQINQMHTWFKELFPFLKNFKDSEWGEQRKETTRTLNILGGSRWFKDNQSVTPDLTLYNLEGRLRQSGISQGLETGEGQTAVNRDLIDLLNNQISIPYYRAGFQEYPAEIPKSLFSYTDNQPPQNISNYSSLFEWYLKQFDGLMGQFPIELKVKDRNSETGQDEERKVELANISEALGEMYGLNQLSTSNSSISINYLTRLATEVLACKNGIVVTQDYARANANYLGYKGNPKVRKIQSNFDIENTDTINDFLQNTEMRVQGWQGSDPNSVDEYLSKIMFSASIIKEMFMRSGDDQMEQLKQEFENLASTKDDDEKWQAFLQALNNPQSRFNRGQATNPKADNKPTDNY